MHRTVQLRMEMLKENGKPYEPTAKVIRGIAPTWVDQSQAGKVWVHVVHNEEL